MTVNQQAIFKGLFTWLWLLCGLGLAVQLFEFANAPEICTSNPLSTYASETCYTSTPTAFGGGLIVVTVLGLVSVSVAHNVVKRAANPPAARAALSDKTPATPTEPPAMSAPAKRSDGPSSRRLWAWSSASEVRLALVTVATCAVIAIVIIAIALSV
ncbi:hypothetical protein [Rhodococcus sp. ACT016]|uniref:hypothetical protein n=1 Tax=Rhodococcus sp. ACT016 TaxID=3134808 RepID=UPI003D28647E